MSQRKAGKQIRASAYIALTIDAKLEKDPEARKRRHDIGREALLLAHQQHQKSKTASGMLQTVLEHYEQYRKENRLPESGDVRQWRQRVSMTDERAYLAMELGFDVADEAVAMWWFGKGLSDLDRVMAIRDCCNAIQDEREQNDLYRKGGAKKPCF